MPSVGQAAVESRRTLGKEAGREVGGRRRATRSAQLNVKPNSFAMSKKRSGEVALPSVMSFSATRLRPSRPNVERLRVSATGRPFDVAVPITGPCTDTGYRIGVPLSVPASNVSNGRHTP